APPVPARRGESGEGRGQRAAALTCERVGGVSPLIAAIRGLTPPARRSDRGGPLTGLADGALLAQLGPTTDFARLLVVLALAQLLLQPTPLQEFLEPAQGRRDRFPVMHTHPQR